MRGEPNGKLRTMERTQLRPIAALAFLVLSLSTGTAGQQSSPQRLTLKEAIHLALKNNLGVLVAGTQIGEAEGTRERRLANLLPRVSGDSLANRQNRNLQVAGISFPGVPTVAGPFSFYDFRVAASQSLIDRQAYHGWKASVKQEESVRLNYQDTRDLVVREAAGLYLNSQSAAAQVQAAESRVATSETLEKLARDQRSQGLATGVDVVRAQVQLARDHQRLLVARNTYQTSLLILVRFLGLTPGTALELAEQLQFNRVDVPNIEEAVLAALAVRSDYRALVIQRQSLIEQQKASHARYFPKLLMSGDYGAIGRNFGAMPRTGEIQGVLSIVLFDRDRNGEQKQLENLSRRLDAQISDLARGIDAELRKAVLDLQSTEEQVRVTEAMLDLAKRELDLAQDRFHNGLADNIEVVTAQDAVASAQNERIAALAQHADGAMALARAVGATEQNYEKYLGGP